MPNQSLRVKSVWRGAVGAFVASVMGIALVGPAQAVNFKLADGAIRGSLDTTVSYDVTVRMERKNKALGSVPSMYGNRAFDKWDDVINRVSASHDLELVGDGWGVFARGNYFYDKAADDLNNKGTGLRGGDKKRMISHGDMTDAYVWWRMFNDDLTVRLGKQVISWGESTFSFHTVNDINTFDITKFRLPGVELKNGLVGTPALYLNWNATDTISVDAFTLFTFDEIQFDGQGAYFLTNDAFSVGDGGLPNAPGAPFVPSSSSSIDKSTGAAVAAP